MLSKEQINLAIAIGNRQAEKVISIRDNKLQKRAVLFVNNPRLVHEIQPQKFRAEFVDKLGPPSKNIIVAEGDSWFDYPFYDILKILEDNYGYDVESVSNRGDRVEDMAFSDGQLEAFARRIEKLLRIGYPPPRAILLSGGGNDIAGDEFGLLLNHKASSISGLNSTVVEGIINERIMSSYLTIIQRITSVCKSRVGYPIPIIVHGYDYPVPDGRGFLGGFWILPGPWFEPGFREKGYAQIQERIDIVKQIIDLFNDMLQKITSLPELNHVHFVNLRETLSSSLVNEAYQDDWGNELHPSEGGFEKITSRIAKVISQLP